MGVDGMDGVELAVEGAGDARSVVEPEEAYAMVEMVELVQESGQMNEGRRMMRDARERLSRGHPPLRLICLQPECVEPWAVGGGRSESCVVSYALRRLKANLAWRLSGL